jgi:hypothetical protein
VLLSSVGYWLEIHLKLLRQTKLSPNSLVQIINLLGLVDLEFSLFDLLLDALHVAHTLPLLLPLFHKNRLLLLEVLNLVLNHAQARLGLPAMCTNEMVTSNTTICLREYMTISL